MGGLVSTSSKVGGSAKADRFNFSFMFYEGPDPTLIRVIVILFVPG